MSRIVVRILKVMLPLVVVAGAGLAAYALFLNRPPVETQAPVIAPPTVRVQQVSFESVALTVTSQGTVQPRTTSQLVPEISGTVIEVAPSFAVGGFFEAGDVLLRIDPYDYQQAVITGRSQLAQAELRLAQEEAEAAVARREWQDLGRGDASPLTLRQPQVADARASVAAAEAALDRATRDLERADVKAPYAGRVQSKDVDVGQFVNKGNTVARIYAVDSAEIRLPLPDEELAYVDVPLSYRGATRESSPRVTISSNFAGREHTWEGRIVRTEGEIDPVSRMVTVVAEVRDPYAPGPDPQRPPLSSGMFVDAEIRGSTVHGVVVLPWAALRGRDQVLVVDDANRLRFRDVEILRTTNEEVMIRAGLAEGESVCISPLDAVTDGMLVRVVDDDLRMAEAAPVPVPVPAETPAPVASPTPAAAIADAQAAAPPEAPAEAPPAARADVEPPPRRDAEMDAIRQALARMRGNSPPAATPIPPPAPAPAPASSPALASSPAPASAPAPAPATITPPAGPRVAFLPFVNVSRNPADGDIGTSLTTALQVALMDGGAASAVPLASTEAALEEATARNARWLVGGGYQRSGDQLRVTARVLAVPDGAVVASVKEDGTVSDLEILADKLIAAVQATLMPTRSSASRPGDGAGSPSAAGNIPPVSLPETSPRRSGRGVAIGRFANISRNPEDDGLAENMIEALAGGLRQLPDLLVVALDSASDAAAMDAATEQNATWLIGGGYQRVGTQVRITARLIDVATGDLVHTFKTDGQVEALASLLEEMVAAVQAALATGDAGISANREVPA